MNRRRMLMALGAGGVAAGVGYLIARTGLGASDSKNALTRLPEFSLPTTRGDIFSSTELAGRITLLNFWATWCAPCRKEIPLLIATQALYRKDVAVVGIAIDELDAVQPFEDEIGLDTKGRQASASIHIHCKAPIKLSCPRALQGST